MPERRCSGPWRSSTSIDHNDIKPGNIIFRRRPNEEVGTVVSCGRPIKLEKTRALPLSAQKHLSHCRNSQEESDGHELNDCLQNQTPKQTKGFSLMIALRSARKQRLDHDLVAEENSIRSARPWIKYHRTLSLDDDMTLQSMASSPARVRRGSFLCERQSSSKS